MAMTLGPNVNINIRPVSMSTVTMRPQFRPQQPRVYYRPEHIHRFRGPIPGQQTGDGQGSAGQTAGGVNQGVGGNTFDGKHLRKAILRRTVDYNSSVINYLQNRLWQRGHKDNRCIQGDPLYAGDTMPPLGHLSNPMNCVTTKFVRTSTNKIKCPIFCLVWTPEGRRLVTGASSGEFTLWNGLTFNFETILQAHDTSIRSMIWSHNDFWMITGDHAGFVKYWQSNMNNVKMFQAHKDPVRGISFCPTDQKFATCSDDGTVRIWDFTRCHEEKILRGHGADVKCLDWHPQKALLVSGSKDTQQPLKLWDPRNGNSLSTIHAHKHTVMSVRWNQNGNWLLSASRDHLVKLFDIRNLKEEMQIFKGHKKEATAVAWNPIHESLFASGGSDGSIMFWMVGSDKEVGGMDQAHDNMVWSLAWHPMGHILASGSNDHSTRFWTRNRPGDNMRDRFNLNTMPLGHDDMFDDGDISTTPTLPGMGLEFGVAEHLKQKEEENIPGLDFDDAVMMAKIQAAQAKKKIPFARPIPKSFENAWSSGIQPSAMRRSAEREDTERADQQGQMDEDMRRDNGPPGHGRGRGRGGPVGGGSRQNSGTSSGVPSLFSLPTIRPPQKNNQNQFGGQEQGGGPPSAFTPGQGQMEQRFHGRDQGQMEQHFRGEQGQMEQQFREEKQEQPFREEQGHADQRFRGEQGHMDQHFHRGGDMQQGGREGDGAFSHNGPGWHEASSDNSRNNTYDRDMREPNQFRQFGGPGSNHNQGREGMGGGRGRSRDVWNGPAPGERGPLLEEPQGLKRSWNEGPGFSEGQNQGPPSLLDNTKFTRTDSQGSAKN